MYLLSTYKLFYQKSTHTVSKHKIKGEGATKHTTSLRLLEVNYVAILSSYIDQMCITS